MDEHNNRNLSFFKRSTNRPFCFLLILQAESNDSFLKLLPLTHCSRRTFSHGLHTSYLTFLWAIKRHAQAKSRFIVKFIMCSFPSTHRPFIYHIIIRKVCLTASITIYHMPTVDGWWYYKKQYLKIAVSVKLAVVCFFPNE